MVALILAVDTTIAFLTDSKVRWIELPIFTEVFVVMLYIIIGITIDDFWHPGWVLCLFGVVFALTEIGVFVGVHNRKKTHSEKNKNYEKYIKTDEKYWTDWEE